MHRLREYAGNAALGVAAIGLGLGALELGARALIASRPPGRSGRQPLVRAVAEPRTSSIVMDDVASRSRFRVLRERGILPCAKMAS